MENKIIKPKELIPIFIMAVLIGVSGIIFHQSPFRILPLFISLVVMILQAKVSRYAYLLGGLNSILYAIVYIYYGVYGVAAQAFFFSFPMQIVTFFNWKKRSDKNTMKFKKMKPWQLLLCIAAYAVSWVGFYFVLKWLGSDYAVLDNTVTLFGVFTSILTAFAFIEYAYMNLFGAALNLVLYIRLIPDNHEQVTYLIYGIYCLICVFMHFRKACRMWKNQNAENAEICSE